MAEQVHPYTNAPLSVSPLTWSHATLVMTVLEYMKRRAAMGSVFKTDRTCLKRGSSHAKSGFEKTVCRPSFELGCQSATYVCLDRCLDDHI